MKRRPAIAALVCLVLMLTIALPVSAATSSYGFSKANNEWTEWDRATWILVSAAKDVNLEIPGNADYLSVNGRRYVKIDAFKKYTVSKNGDALTLSYSSNSTVTPDPSQPLGEMPKTAREWNNFTARYTASGAKTHITTDEKYANYSWGDGKHFSEGELLDTANNSWQRVGNRAINVSVPEFHILVVSDGTMLINHYYKQSGKSQALTATVAAGQTYRIMKCNDLGDLKYVFGAFEEAAWHLEKQLGAKFQAAKCQVYGNGKLAFSFSLEAAK